MIEVGRRIRCNCADRTLFVRSSLSQDRIVSVVGRIAHSTGSSISAVCCLTRVYGLPPRCKRFIDGCGKRGEPAVVYPASGVGARRPVPKWNLRTPLRQSLQAASVRLPAGLSASSEVGTTRVAMMGDQSVSKAVGGVKARQGVFQAGSANAVRVTFLFRRAVPNGSPSRSVA